MREMSTVNEQIKLCYDELSKENQEVLKMNKELHEQIKALRSDRPLLLAAELENRNLHLEIQKLNSEKETMKAQIRCVEKQRDKLEKEIEDLQNEVAHVTQHTVVVEKRKEKLENDLESAKTTITELYLAVESLDVVYEKCCAMEDELKRTKVMLEKSEANVDILYDELTQKHNEELELLHDSFSVTTAKLEAVIAEKDETIANLTRSSIRLTDDMSALEDFDHEAGYPGEIFPANFSFSSLPPDDPHPSVSVPEAPKQAASNSEKTNKFFDWASISLFILIIYVLLCSYFNYPVAFFIPPCDE